MNTLINVIQITALLVFAAIAIAYRAKHPQDSIGWHLSNGITVQYQVDTVPVVDDKGQPVQDTFADGSPKVDAAGQPVAKTVDRVVTKEDLANKEAPLPPGLAVGDPYPLLQRDDAGKLVLVDGHTVALPFTVSYLPGEATSGKAGDPKNPLTFNFHKTAASVVAPHSFNYIFIQACIAILILVGFESVTAMGEEAKNATRDVPRAVLLSLLIQGCFCYFLEYFAANYLLHNGYTMSMAGASGAPIGDEMLIVGSWLFGSYRAGWWFMMVQAATVFLALIGTTLSCLSTGARVTYAMGREGEVGTHFGLLHGRTGSPHRAIWTLAVISALLGIVTVSVYLGAQPIAPAALDPKYHNVWYSFGIFPPAAYTWLPNSLLIVTLTSNFGTFLLYMTTCAITIVAFRQHDAFHGFKHVVIPVFGLFANLACMLFYLIGPFMVSNMSWHESYIALGVAAVWGIYGLFYFLRSSKLQGKEVILTARAVQT